MSKLYLDLSVAIFFLVALIFVYNLKSQIESRDKAIFKILVAGFGLFSVMSLAGAFFNQLLEHNILGVESVTFIEIGRMAFFILGLILVTSGIARWLAIAGLAAACSFYAIPLPWCSLLSGIPGRLWQVPSGHLRGRSGSRW